MRVDVVTIFPDYLRPLELSLAGRARQRGLLDVAVHDLRDWAHDRHRTVDDTPAGGGAGMVMRPEPWGEALDALAPDGATLLVPTPAGERFTQRVAADLATRDHLVVACGRYEGIDQRVLDEAGRRLAVRELSLGDYVLNGGEVAALTMVEAVARLLPGFVGNADSLAEESHGADGLLEYPVYTRPSSWRGHDVPPVLLSGDHARIAEWRHDQALRRTTLRRPDLLPPTTTGETVIAPAGAADAGELLTLQRACWLQEAQANPDLGLRGIPALTESLADVQRWVTRGVVLLARRGGRLVGAARGELTGDVWEVGRLMVAPDLQGEGLGRTLLELVESAAPAGTASYALFTGARSERNLRSYRRAGYRPAGEVASGVVRLTKAVRRR